MQGVAINSLEAGYHHAAFFFKSAGRARSAVPHDVGIQHSDFADRDGSDMVTIHQNFKSDHVPHFTRLSDCVARLNRFLPRFPFEPAAGDIRARRRSASTIFAWIKTDLMLPLV
jgi:hypothetical protein